jgi:translation elongation factor EF-Tu-like GTPase
MSEEEIGKVSHYFGKIHVAAIDLTDGELHVGDKVHINGHTSDFTQTIDSMEIDRHPVAIATVGESVGARVAQHAREHDAVFKVTD